ncbi:MAG: 2Fe-2S iron-sulfur cluster-binding protein, partial [Paracoccaceae bacterium]
MDSHLTCRINGADHAIDVSSGESLLFFLRDKAGLRSARFGCGQGTCGACTVIIDG